MATSCLVSAMTSKDMLRSLKWVRTYNWGLWCYLPISAVRENTRKLNHNKALLIMILLIVVLPMISPSLNIVGYLVSPAVMWLNGLYMGLVWNLAGG